MALLTYEAVEAAVKNRVEMKTRNYGQEVRVTQQDDGADSLHKVEPTLVANLYKNWTMPLTKEVQSSHTLSLKPQQQIEEEKVKSCTRCSREFEAMEKALTKVNSLKVGSLWISKKAKEEFSNITEDINTISNTVEEKARWVFNKLKGKPLKSLPDLLREYNLPPGLFPQNITCYEFDESKAKLIVYLSSACEVSFKDSSVIRYAPRVKTILTRGKLTGIEGMKTKVLVWVKVTSVAVESYKSDKVWFTAGVKKSRPKIAYDVPQAAIRVEEF
ncbi:hypothetical protein H0E87_016073 [Populus deltoides]|uniref:chorismate mutase n=1 Tax=Populus deltoides TaxID=3696 RepID=A0A8T2Y7G0_POPDE|nr:hypothetical protein H0E87_016073 [Populus deltoides]